MILLFPSWQGPNVLEEQDLVEMGIIKNTHQVTILAASSQLKPVKPIGKSPYWYSQTYR